ncbi:hypothetical protein ABZ027_22930 [Streptomyces sp. NPDC006332]|uniref:hypothetical protein n=1 Tax=Streptomyces sp. NPDC006332 TaxID=3155456 RepID=UPI0033A5CDEE
MTAEHDGFAEHEGSAGRSGSVGRDGSLGRDASAAHGEPAEHDASARADALMVAITGEPLSEAARADAAFMAEHRSAEADLALLREQLGFIGDALGEPTEAPRTVPVRPPLPRRRAFRLAFGTLAVAAVAVVLSGMGWLLSQAGSGIGDASDSAGGSAASKQDAGVRFGSPRYLACARTVVAGTVARLEQLPDTEQLRVTVQVTRYYKPERGEDRLTFVIGRYDVTELHKGDQVLLGVPRDSATPDHWAVGEREVARERAWITASLPESRTLTCS